MKKRILFVGYRGKKTHLSPKHDFLLLTSKSEFRPEYRDSFVQVILVEDIFNWKEVRSVLAEIKFDGVLTRFEDFIVPTAAIAEEKGLPGIVFEKSVTFRNKFSMKEAFAKKNVPAADFVLMNHISQAENFLSKHDFPLILKQLSGVHSRFVAKVKSREDLEQTLIAFQKEIGREAMSLHDKLYNHDRIPSTPDPRTHFLLEELLIGEELSIDAITVDGKHRFTPICRYVTSDELGIQDHHLPIRILPSDYTEAQKDIIYDTVRQALNALGVNFCGSHTEVFFNRKTNDCAVVEVAARSGGFRGEMFHVSTKGAFNLHETCVQAALGESVTIPDEYPVFTAVVEVFAPNFGHLESIDYSCLKNRTDTQSIDINGKKGDFVGPASRGGKYIMKFLIHGENFEETLDNATKLLYEIRDSIQLQ